MLYESLGFAAANFIWGVVAAGLAAAVAHLPHAADTATTKLLQAGQSF